MLSSLVRYQPYHAALRTYVGICRLRPPPCRLPWAGGDPFSGRVQAGVQTAGAYRPLALTVGSSPGICFHDLEHDGRRMGVSRRRWRRAKRRRGSPSPPPTGPPTRPVSAAPPQWLDRAGPRQPSCPACHCRAAAGTTPLSLCACLMRECALALLYICHSSLARSIRIAPEH